MVVNPYVSLPSRPFPFSGRIVRMVADKTRTNTQQVVEFVKRAQATNASVDSPTVAGGSAGKIALANAA